MQLTEAQRKAVETNEDNIYVSAGAGCAKTTVLVARAVNLLESGVQPHEIMLVTFTRKAAEEIRSRIVGGIEEKAGPIHAGYGKPYIGTFHALALDAIRCSGRNVSVIDDATLDDFIRMTARDIGYLKGKTWKAGLSLSKCRQAFTGEAATPEEAKQPAFLIALGVNVELVTYSLYTYPMLLDGMVELLTILPADHWLAGIEHVLVDEGQDCDYQQCEIIELLHEHGASVFAVGDPRQRIYGWRGACGYSVVLNEQEIHLTECFRCPPAVLAPANRLMADYPPLEAVGDHRDNVFFVIHGRTNDVRLEIEGAHAQGYAWDDIAILVRSNRSARRYQTRLRDLAPEIPTYRVGATLDESDTPEFRKPVAAMRLLADPCNPLLFRHACEMLDVPRDKELEARKLAAHGGSFISAMSGAGLVAFDVMLDLSVDKDADAPDGRDTMSVISLLNETVAFKPDIVDWWERNCPLVRWSSVASCLDWLAGYTADDEQVPEGNVVISTIHSAKGLEWPVVIVPDLNEGNLPTAQAIKAGDVDEERRCLYVAITRAKEVCLLHYRRAEDQAADREIKAPSRFLEELK